jgi:hypothetical protein
MGFSDSEAEDTKLRPTALYEDMPKHSSSLTGPCELNPSCVCCWYFAVFDPQSIPVNVFFSI